MLPLTYFFKVILCSAVFLAYYLIALRNKKFHQYNRFYLLFSVVASWLIPLIKFQITTTEKMQEPIYQAFNYIVESNAAFEFEPIQEVKPSFDWTQLIPIAYTTIAAIIFIATIVSISKIFSIYKKHPKQKANNITFINTQESSTPFSFFNNIFWNTNIDANTNTGKQILQHELTHVNEKHSWDKIFMQINIMLGWFNPCFWLIKSELEMIHEFIADNKAIESADAADFASMLLLATFPTHQYKLTNPFFFSPIKRRLIMLTQNKNPRLSYLRRLIILPLLATVVLLFAFRKKDTAITNSILKKVGIEINDNKKQNDSSKIGTENAVQANRIRLITTLSKKYKIVIDAGHGGTDFGCKSTDGTVYEKDIDLAIAKSIKQLNNNKNIEIVLTRDDDRFDNVKSKADFINKQNADLCVSIHCSDAGKNVQANGTEIYIVSQEKNNGFMNESNLLAQSVNGFIKNDFVSRGIKTKAVGIWILQAAKCPIILLESGFLSNKDDAAMLQKVDKQELIANDILKGIENYLAQNEQNIVLPKQEIVEKDTIQLVNLNGDIIETKVTTKANDAAIEEYHNLVKKYTTKNGKPKFNFGKITEEENNRMMEIFFKMSKEQQENEEVHFVKAPPPYPKSIPTAEQLNKWAKNKSYGIWVDGHRIVNNQLLKYSAADFSNFDASKLYGAAIGKDGHTVQLDLMTNKYYENYLKESKKEKYWLVWRMNTTTSSRLN